MLVKTAVDLKEKIHTVGQEVVSADMINNFLVDDGLKMFADG